MIIAKKKYQDPNWMVFVHPLIAAPLNDKSECFAIPANTNVIIINSKKLLHFDFLFIPLNKEMIL